MSSFSREIDHIVDLVTAQAGVSATTDKYFTFAKRVIEQHGDRRVVYAVFMRRRVVAACGIAIALVRRLVPDAVVTAHYAEGDIVPSESKLFSIEGSYAALSELETLLLQKTGIACVAAFNAYSMCRALPSAAFMDMHARHGSGAEMNLVAAYGAAVGSAAAKRDNPEIKGFIGSSQDLTAPLFGRSHGMGTMPHALVGYAGGDVVKACQIFVEAVPEVDDITALVDYRGLEITDALACARWFFEEARLHEQGKRLGIRLDTHGGRFAEHLDYPHSVETVGHWLNVRGEYSIVEQVLGTRAFLLDIGDALVDRLRRQLFGPGVSAACVIQMRQALDAAGYKDARIVASSGFGVAKCIAMSAVNAPLDMVGTGSFLPDTLSETYATADIISYDGHKQVKVGREFLWE